MTIIVRSMYNFVNCLQFNIRYEKVERPAPVGGALVFRYYHHGYHGIVYCLLILVVISGWMWFTYSHVNK